jgi:hypothetical protein
MATPGNRAVRRSKTVQGRRGLVAPSAFAKTPPGVAAVAGVRRLVHAGSRARIDRYRWWASPIGRAARNRDPADVGPGDTRRRYSIRVCEKTVASEGRSRSVRASGRARRADGQHRDLGTASTCAPNRSASAKAYSKARAEGSEKSTGQRIRWMASMRSSSHEQWCFRLRQGPRRGPWTRRPAKRCFLESPGIYSKRRARS